MKKKFLGLVELLIGLALIGSASTTALGEEFYKGKIIRFIVSFAPGGGYDIYTRAVARHIGKRIPGDPMTIVQNMTGGGGLMTADYIYSRAKPDGLTVGIWPSGLVLRQALGDRSITFEADEFGWIGAPSKTFSTCAIMGFTGLKTLKDVLSGKKPIKMAGTSPGSEPSDLPRILNLTSDTKFHVIHGYAGMPTVLVALRKREADGVCYGWESMRTTARSMLDADGNNKLIPFVTYGDSGDPELKDLPQLNEIVRGKENLAILKAWLLQQDFMRPLTLPPGTPKERLGILRKAFKTTLEDPRFLAEAKRSNLVIDYVSGEEIEKLVDQILALSPETKAKLQFLLE